MAPPPPPPPWGGTNRTIEELQQSHETAHGKMITEHEQTMSLIKQEYWRLNSKFNEENNTIRAKIVSLHDDIDEAEKDNKAGTNRNVPGGAAGALSEVAVQKLRVKIARLNVDLSQQVLGMHNQTTVHLKHCSILKDHQDKEMTDLFASHNAKLKDLWSELQRQRGEVIRTNEKSICEQNHRQAIAQLSTEHQDALSTQHIHYESALSQQKQDHEDTLTTLKTEHKSQVESFENSHLQSKKDAADAMQEKIRLLNEKYENNLSAEQQKHQAAIAGLQDDVKQRKAFQMQYHAKVTRLEDEKEEVVIKLQAEKAIADEKFKNAYKSMKLGLKQVYNAKEWKLKDCFKAEKTNMEEAHRRELFELGERHKAAISELVSEHDEKNRLQEEKQQGRLLQLEKNHMQTILDLTKEHEKQRLADEESQALWEARATDALKKTENIQQLYTNQTIDNAQLKKQHSEALQQLEIHHINTISELRGTISVANIEAGKQKMQYNIERNNKDRIIAQLQTEIQIARNNLSNATIQMNSLVSQQVGSVLSAKEAAMAQNRAQYDKKINMLISDVVRRDETIQYLRKTNANDKGVVDARVQKALEEIEKLEKDKEALQKRIEEVQKDLVQKRLQHEADITDRKKSLRAAQDEINGLKARESEHEQAIRSLEAQRKAVEDDFEKRISECNDKIHKLYAEQDALVQQEVERRMVELTVAQTSPDNNELFPDDGIRIVMPKDTVSKDKIRNDTRKETASKDEIQFIIPKDTTSKDEIDMVLKELMDDCDRLEKFVYGPPTAEEIELYAEQRKVHAELTALLKDHADEFTYRPARHT